MKITKNTYLLIVSSIALFFSCNTEDIINDSFKQPSIEVVSCSLEEIPDEYTLLKLDINVINNDNREAQIKDIEYEVEIEGIKSEVEQMDINKKITTSEALELTLPLKLKTTDAIEFLLKLDAGQELSYHVNGIFHVDDLILKRFDLDIDIEGKTFLDIGLDDFYTQPELSVIDITGVYGIDILANQYTFDLDVNCYLKNIDEKDVIIDESEYYVTVEGIKSEKQLYSDTYTSNIVLNSGDSILLNLPVKMILSATQGIQLVASMGDGTADYIVEGTFHPISVDSKSTNFYLPLYITGSCPVSSFTK